MSNKTLVLTIGSLAFGVGAAFYSLHDSSPDCSGGGRACPKTLSVEDPNYKLALYDERAGRRGISPTGALAAAVEAKKSMEFLKAGVKGSSGVWKQYGSGPLLSSGLVQQQLDSGVPGGVPETYLQEYAGRVDNFAYDATHKRLFAAVGTGGIWMSEAKNGDVRTLGDYWVSVGDNLPYQATGAVLWAGETLIALTGDSVLSTGTYTGIGAFWSTDLGGSWHKAAGFPEDVSVFNSESDPGNPNIAYVATSRGLYRTSDAGRSFVNVALPTGDNAGVNCTGNIDPASPCNLANVVTDVVVKAPGGVGSLDNDFRPEACSSTGCPVLAAVGWRAGRLNYPGTEVPQSPSNGLYRSDNGQPGSFTRLELATLDPLTEAGFTPQDRIGRIEMGAALGPGQDHNYVYAVVQDSELLNGQPALGDPPLPALPVGAGLLSGIFVSPDFGSTWTRMATSTELITGSALGALIIPGQQAFYNAWIQVDPTRAFVPAVDLNSQLGVSPGLGIPTRIAFGLEELFQNRLTHVPLNGALQAGPSDFLSLTHYFSVTGADQSVHPDQHAGLYIPVTDPLLGEIGVCLFSGHDGGVNRQCVGTGGEMTDQIWGVGHNRGFYTLLPYGLGVAKDGTVWFGLQDNGSGHIDPTGENYQDFGGDGFFAEVDPDNSDLAYTESQNGGLRRTSNRGLTSTAIAPPYNRANFANWFSMDPLDANHMITTANEIYETLDAPNVTGSSWDFLCDMGTRTDAEGNEIIYTATVADVHGAAIYAGACGDCGVTANDGAFSNRLANNIAGVKPTIEGCVDGWHYATAKGLPNRLITAIEIDPSNPKTVYVGLGSYMSAYRGPGSFAEDSTGADVKAGQLFKSTDAGETFKSITGNLPRLSINTVVARNGQLLVGTDIGAFISSDLNGSSWAPMGTGLPAAPISQFKLQPGNPNMLFASTFGRHIWTYEFTGDAAISQDKATELGLSPKGRGLFLGAFAPWLLLVLGAALWGRTRRRTV